jgi:formate hydrogenlyase subunit 3/multisubunit Na+/H+ antiporter MnhD subunit
MRTYLTIASIIFFALAIIFLITVFWCKGGSMPCWLQPRNSITGGDSLFYAMICLSIAIVLIIVAYSVNWDKDDGGEEEEEGEEDGGEEGGEEEEGGEDEEGGEE